MEGICKPMILKVDNVNVYNLENATRQAGFPMSVNTVDVLPSLDRAKQLGRVPVGSGHDSFLKGILVTMDITAPQYWWLQWQRYHFHDIVSSQSKMHRIMKFNLIKQVNEYVTEQTVSHLQELIKVYNENKTLDNFMRVMSNVPMGLLLTAGVVTNYLQLKTIYHQRKNHKLIEWKLFLQEVEKLPHFLDLT